MQCQLSVPVELDNYYYYRGLLKIFYGHNIDAFLSIQGFYIQIMMLAQINEVLFLK